MTDIVERLRFKSGTHVPVIDTMDEAADEIERLRAAITYMNEHADSPTIIRREARRTLEPKPGPPEGWKPDRWHNTDGEAE